jgi:hypothetical protein
MGELSTEACAEAEHDHYESLTSPSNAYSPQKSALTALFLEQT